MTEREDRTIKIIIFALGVFIIFFVTFLLPRGIFHFIFGYVVQSLVNISGMSHWLAKGIVILSLIPFFWALCELFKIRYRINLFRKKPIISHRKLAGVIVFVYIGIFFLSMYFVSRESYFTHDSGEVLKWYAETPEGTRFFDSSGYDPKYGIKLKPVTPEMMEKYKKKLMKMHPKRIAVPSLEEVEFFDSISGKPKIWYYQDNEGLFEFFDGPGFHPTYRTELKPVTPEVILSLKRKIREEQERIAAEKEKRQKDEERQKFLAHLERYINLNFTNHPGSEDVAVLVIGDDLQEKHGIEQTIATILKAQGKNPVLSLFKKPFVGDGMFEKIFSGRLDIVRSLGLKKHADYITLVKKYSKFRTNPQILPDVISADFTLQIKIISTDKIKVVNSTNISAISAGFSNKDAEKKALELVYSDLKKFLKGGF